MATKRMFAQEIINDQLFTDMGSSAQALYFHLGMIADDDGFVNNPRDAQTKAHASDDDLRVLVSKKYVLFIRNGLVVITDWKANNYIQKDRYKPTRYTEEKNLLEIVNGKYQFKPNLLEGVQEYNDSCIQNGYTDKERIDKNSIDKNRLDNKNEVNEKPKELGWDKAEKIFEEMNQEDDSFNPDDELPF